MLRPRQDELREPGHTLGAVSGQKTHVETQNEKNHHHGDIVGTKPVDGGVRLVPTRKEGVHVVSRTNNYSLFCIAMLLPRDRTDSNIRQKSRCEVGARSVSKKKVTGRKKERKTITERLQLGKRSHSFALIGSGVWTQRDVFFC